MSDWLQDERDLAAARCLVRGARGVCNDPATWLVLDHGLMCEGCAHEYLRNGFAAEEVER